MKRRRLHPDIAECLQREFFSDFLDQVPYTFSCKNNGQDSRFIVCPKCLDPAVPLKKETFRIDGRLRDMYLGRCSCGTIFVGLIAAV